MTIHNVGVGIVEGATGRVVVGVDGSAESQGALRWAASHAELIGAQLEVVTSWDDAEVGAFVSIAWNPEVDAASMLTRSIEAEFGPHPPAWVSAVVERGKPSHVLVERGAGAEMLVLGKRGHTALSDFIMGSVSERCANLATCAVVIVPFAAKGETA